MTVSFVDAPSFRYNFRCLLQNCTRLDVAMAYVKVGGLKTFLNALNRSNLIKEKKPVRIVFGLCSRQGITDKKSAQLLLKFSQEQKNVTVKKYNSPKFHPKLMVFYGKPNSVLIGSSNLTAAAYSKNAEANVIVEDPEKKFMEAATGFFEKCFDNAPFLEQKHVDAYNPQKHHFKGKDGHGIEEDELPTFSTPVPLSKGRLGVGIPRKSKSHYDEKIHNLKSRKYLTRRQKRSLAAYRANRTRYYGSLLKLEQKFALLVPVTYGEPHLQDIANKGHGMWKVGRRLSENRISVINHVYFYEYSIKKVRYEGNVPLNGIKLTPEGKAILTVDKISKLKSRKLGKFKKPDGENVRFLRCFAYVLE